MRTAVITVIMLLTAVGEYQDAKTSGESTPGVILTIVLGTIAVSIIITVVVMGLDYRKRNP